MVLGNGEAVMTLFLWTLIALLALSILGKLAWLATGKFPQRRPGAEALDVCCNTALIVWAAVLLAGA